MRNYKTLLEFHNPKKKSLIKSGKPNNTCQTLFTGKNPASGNTIPRASLSETRGDKDHCISRNLFNGNQPHLTPL